MECMPPETTIIQLTALIPYGKAIIIHPVFTPKKINLTILASGSEVELAIKTIGKTNLIELVRSGSLGLHEGIKVLKI